MSNISVHLGPLWLCYFLKLFRWTYLLFRIVSWSGVKDKRQRLNRSSVWCVATRKIPLHICMWLSWLLMLTWLTFMLESHWSSLGAVWFFTTCSGLWAFGSHLVCNTFIFYSLRIHDCISPAIHTSCGSNVLWKTIHGLGPRLREWLCYTTLWYDNTKCKLSHICPGDKKKTTFKILFVELCG